jgi:hypothetical protein
VQFLGKSEKGVYLATVQDKYRLRVWTLTESCGHIYWVLKHHTDLEPLAMVRFRGLRLFDKTWTIVGDDDVPYYYDYYYGYDYYDGEEEEEDEDEVENTEVEVKEEEEDKEDDKIGEGVQKENNKMVMSKDHEWNSDDDNVLRIEDYDTWSGEINFLGFHPYKEIIFLGLTSLIGVAFHLKSSKVHYLGKMRPSDYGKSPTNGIYEVFPYTPCMIGELLNS